MSIRTVTFMYDKLQYSPFTPEDIVKNNHNLYGLETWIVTLMQIQYMDPTYPDFRYPKPPVNEQITWGTDFYMHFALICLNPLVSGSGPSFQAQLLFYYGKFLVTNPNTLGLTTIMLVGANLCAHVVLHNTIKVSKW